jgi:hypothetical protein
MWSTVKLTELLTGGTWCYVALMQVGKKWLLATDSLLNPGTAAKVAHPSPHSDMSVQPIKAIRWDISTANGLVSASVEYKWKIDVALQILDNWYYYSFISHIFIEGLWILGTKLGWEGNGDVYVSSNVTSKVHAASLHIHTKTQTCILKCLYKT